MFLSAEGALHWAYNTVSRPIVEMSAVNHMRQEPSRGVINMLLEGLNLQDLHGQAAQIIGMVEQLEDPTEREYIEARFGRKLRRDDLEIVVYRGCAVLGFGISKPEMDAVYRIMSSYFSGDMSHRDIRKILGCRYGSAVLVKNCLYDTLDRIHHLAMADMSEVLREHGLLRDESSYA